MWASVRRLGVLLKEGSTIPFTQSAIVLESLVNKFFANMAGRDNSDSGSSGSAGASGKNGESGGDAGKEKQK